MQNTFASQADHDETINVVQEMRLEEKLHWLSCIMGVRKRKRRKLLDEMPFDECRWLADCAKTQVPAAVLKFCLDSQQNTVLLWPPQQLLTKCDFCVAGNSVNAIAQLQSLMANSFAVNVSGWWKRYVRCAPTTRYAKLSTAPKQTLHCFVLLNKPDFFEPTPVVTATAIALANKIDTEPTASINIATVETNAADTSESCVDPPPKKTRKTYRCQVCNQPKKGHQCVGLTAPPVPPSPVNEKSIGLLVPPPVPMLPLAEQAISFDSVFIEDSEDEATTDEPILLAASDRNMSRLERIFGRSFECNTSAIRDSQLDKQCRAERRQVKSTSPLLARNNPTKTSTTRSEQKWSTEIDLLN